MPELPETETIARDLDAEIRGLTIRNVDVRRPDVLREVSAIELRDRTIGRAITNVWRRAKLVVLDLSSEDRLVVQPRFTGALLICRGPLDGKEAPYSTLDFTLSDGRNLHYRDIRRLGTVSLMDNERFFEYTGKLGVEPLDQTFTEGHLSVIVRASSQAVKKVLMDQRVIAGIGNIYANEACWRAGVDPSRAARSLAHAEVTNLHAAITSVLRESIAVRGTSFRDYVDARGERGGFVHHLAVYGRGGLPCNRCGARLVETHAIDDRTTVLCARCQK